MPGLAAAVETRGLTGVPRLALASGPAAAPGLDGALSLAWAHGLAWSRGPVGASSLAGALARLGSLAYLCLVVRLPRRRRRGQGAKLWTCRSPGRADGGGRASRRAGGRSQGGLM